MDSLSAQAGAPAGVGDPTQEMVRVGLEAMLTDNVLDSSEQGRVRRIYRAMEQIRLDATLSGQTAGATHRPDAVSEKLIDALMSRMFADITSGRLEDPSEHTKRARAALEDHIAVISDHGSGQTAGAVPAGDLPSVEALAHEAEIWVGLVEMLKRDHERMRKAGTMLAEAALYTIGERDGLHRLALAASGWAKAVADEGDRARLAAQSGGSPAAAGEGHCAWRSGCKHTVSCRAEGRCIGQVLAAGDALFDQQNKPAPGFESPAAFATSNGSKGQG